MYYMNIVTPMTLFNTRITVKTKSEDFFYDDKEQERDLFKPYHA